MTPAQLVRETRLRKGLTQRQLALRAGTSQSAVARIERGDEEPTWPRFKALMVSMGEEPAVSSTPLKSRYDAWDMEAQRAQDPTWRLESGLAFDRLTSDLALQVEARSREPVT
jgi:transcriptional regulator with XRE-family HTH domain